MSSYSQFYNYWFGFPPTFQCPDCNKTFRIPEPNIKKCYKCFCVELAHEQFQPGGKGAIQTENHFNTYSINYTNSSDKDSVV